MKAFFELVVCEDVERKEEQNRFYLQGHRNFCLITVLGKHFWKWERAFTSAKPNCFSLKAVLALSPPLLCRTNGGDNVAMVIEILTTHFA